MIGALGAPARRPPTATSTSGRASLIGAPAVAGVVAGTALQQRISERAVARAFVALLVASAAVLIF